MRRTRSLELVPIDFDIDRTLRRLNRERKQLVLEEESVMGEEINGENQVPNRTLKDYSIPNVTISSIRRPAVQANNFEIKSGIIQMIQNLV